MLLAEADDVPHDEEVARELELLDQRELLLDLGLRFGGERPEAGARAVPGELAKVGGGRLAGRQRIIGKPVAQIGEREVERAGEIERRSDRLGVIAPQLRHLARSFQVTLAFAVEQRAGAVEPAAQPQAGEHVVETLAVLARVAHTVGGEQRQVGVARQLEQRLVELLLGAQRVALDFDREAAVEDRAQSIEQAAGLGSSVRSMRAQRACERPLFAAGEAPQSTCVRGERVPVDARFAFGVGQRAGGEHAAQVLVAGTIGDQYRDASFVLARELQGIGGVSRLARFDLRRALSRRVDHDLDTHQRLDARGAGGLVETRRAVNAVAVDQSDGGKLELGRALDQVFGE